VEFKRVHEGINCNCIEDANENNADLFARKVGDTKDLKERDFRTHYERGKLSATSDCKEICGLRGLSFEIWSDASRADLMKRYSITSGIQPKAKKQLFIFKIKENAGLVKYTPEQPSGYNAYHYDFFKEDNFTIELLALQESYAI